ncbi:MAG: hypothetical protein WBB43_25965 [Limnoraphis sp.]
MSRLDDIIELIQTTNEVYFITAPGRVRTAYILIDDIIELSLKIFLQEKAYEQRINCQRDLENARLVTTEKHLVKAGTLRDNLRRYFEEKLNIEELSNNLKLGTGGISILQGYFASYPLIRHWSANDPNSRKTFDKVIDDVKPFFALPTTAPVGTPPNPATSLLDEALIRHKTRNKFYHDQNLSGLDINDEKCLSALCAMFDLVEHLFPTFSDEVKRKHTVRCQIGVLRLKQTASLGHRELSQPYEAALKLLKKGHKYDFESRSVEHSLVHTVSDRFFDSLREQFKNKIAKLQVRINKIDNMKRPRQDHIDEKNDTEKLIQILQKQLDQINALLGTS